MGWTFSCLALKHGSLAVKFATIRCCPHLFQKHEVPRRASSTARIMDAGKRRNLIRQVCQGARELLERPPTPRNQSAIMGASMLLQAYSVLVDDMCQAERIQVTNDLHQRGLSR